jgi:hypothetical protein
MTQFRERFLRGDCDGGISAAHTLSHSIKGVLLPRLGEGADKYRVMVRVYADLAGLSKAMHRAGAARGELRSLSSFATGFTCSQEYFEFVDAGVGRDCTSSKIKGMREKLKFLCHAFILPSPLIG